MAHWLIQRGFDSDRQYLKLIEHIQRMEIPHTFCTVVPFTESDEGIILETPLPENIDIFTYGSYSLSKHAVRRGYFPGAFISDNSSIDIAITGKDELKVIEVNSINSSGLYAIDVQKLINAIEGMTFER